MCILHYIANIFFKITMYLCIVPVLMLHAVYCKAHISTKEVSYVDLFNQVLNFQFNFYFNCKIYVFFLFFPYSSVLVCEWPLSLCSLCMCDVEWSSWIYFSISILNFSPFQPLLFILKSFVDLDNFWVSIMNCFLSRYMY